MNDFQATVAQKLSEGILDQANANQLTAGADTVKNDYGCTS
jgi:hypothetical protein